MNIKRILFATATGALMLGSLVVFAWAASPLPHRPDAVSTGPESYVMNSEWVTGISQDGGRTGQSLKMTDLAFYAFPDWWDQKLENVNQISASWLLQVDSFDTGGASPKFSLELDANHDGVFTEPAENQSGVDVVVYLDPATCSDPAPSGGAWVESYFTGDRTSCSFTDSKGNLYESDKADTAWNKLVAQYPDANVWLIFLSQDATAGTNYVDRIMLDNALFTREP